MLEESCKLSFAVVRDIFDHGFSRVPVYARERQHVVGLLFVKDLIFVDPEDEVPLAEYLRVFERSIELVDAEANLDDVLRIFKRGRGHLALVLGQPRKSSMVESDCMSPLHNASPSYIVGLVTLEDIIEEILGDEIIDETDVYVDVDNHVKVDGRSKFVRTGARICSRRPHAIDATPRLTVRARRISQSFEGWTAPSSTRRSQRPRSKPSRSIWARV